MKKYLIIAVIVLLTPENTGNLLEMLRVILLIETIKNRSIVYIIKLTLISLLKEM